MSQQETSRVKLKVTPQVALIIAPGASRELQLDAARGALALQGRELLTVLFFLCVSQDIEVRRQAIKTLKELPVEVLSQVLDDPQLPWQLLDLLVRAKISDEELMALVISHPAVQDSTLLYLAEKSDLPVLQRLAGHQCHLVRNPAVLSAIIANPRADQTLRLQLNRQETIPEKLHERSGPCEEDDAADDVLEGYLEDVDVSAFMEEAEKDGASKFQIAMDLQVAEKIKIGLTGDKEWRSILIKDSNKLVQGAVMKNPRITDGEVIFVAKNRTASDELIRQILLNKDWMKLYEVKKALATHPKTPLPKALRLLSMLNTKDLKELMRSKNVSTVISTTARKEFENRQKRGGG